MFKVSFDADMLLSDVRRIARFASQESIAPAADVVLVRIRRLTAQGVDADGNPFHPYSPPYASWRRKEGLQTSKKDLRVSGKMLGSIRLDEAEKALVPGAGTEKIVHGQMYHPRWKYHHNFFAVGTETFRVIEHRMVQELRAL